MGFFDDALKNSVPGGDLATPIAIAAGALLLHHLFAGGSQPATPAAPSAPAPGAPAPQAGGGLLDGLSNIIGKLTSGGAAPQVNSWVGTGANQPIEPGQLGAALGPQTISELAAKSGLTEEQLLSQLALVLPQLVNHLTPAGRLPTAAELEAPAH